MPGPNDYYAPGEWNVACSECGRKIKSSEAVKNWMGQYRCKRHNEPRHPQDFVKATVDIQTPAFTQPQTDRNIILPIESAIPGFAIPGWSIPGVIPT